MTLQSIRYTHYILHISSHLAVYESTQNILATIRTPKAHYTVRVFKVNGHRSQSRTRVSTWIRAHRCDSLAPLITLLPILVTSFRDRINYLLCLSLLVEHFLLTQPVHTSALFFLLRDIRALHASIFIRNV